MVWPAEHVPRTRTVLLGVLTRVDSHRGRVSTEVDDKGVFTTIDEVSPVSTPVKPVLSDMKPRLEKAAAAVVDARDAYNAALEQRNELVLAAVDNGMSQRQVAKAAGVSVGRITALLLTGYPD